MQDSNHTLRYLMLHWNERDPNHEKFLRISLKTFQYINFQRELKIGRLPTNSGNSVFL